MNETRGLISPNLDALAHTGIILKNYYVQPICSPTRSALMTGKFMAMCNVRFCAFSEPPCRSLACWKAPPGLLFAPLPPSKLTTCRESNSYCCCHVLTSWAGRYTIRLGTQSSVIYWDNPWGVPINETFLVQNLKSVGYHTALFGKVHAWATSPPPFLVYISVRPSVPHSLPPSRPLPPSLPSPHSALLLCSASLFLSLSVLGCATLPPPRSGTSAPSRRNTLRWDVGLTSTSATTRAAALRILTSPLAAPLAPTPTTKILSASQAAGPTNRKPPRKTSEGMTGSPLALRQTRSARQDDGLHISSPRTAALKTIGLTSVPPGARPSSR